SRSRISSSTVWCTRSRATASATNQATTASTTTIARATSHGQTRRRRRGVDGCSHPGSGWVGFASAAVLASHPLRRTHAEKVKSIAQHLAGGVVEPQPRRVNRLDGLVAQRDHAAVVVPAVVKPGELL